VYEGVTVLVGVIDGVGFGDICGPGFSSIKIGISIGSLITLLIS
jgi:hypothetical protein